MIEQKHTPGEWTHEPHGDTIALYAGRAHGMNGRHGLRLMNLDDGDNNFEANARLISAAPDMLEALEQFVEEYVEMINSGDCGFWDPEKEDKVIKARAALSKAKGS